MSPGPVSSHSRGGFGFTHGADRTFGHRQAPFYGTLQASPPVNRVCCADRQRFSVAANDAGGSTIILTDDEVVTLGVGEDGGVTIMIDPQPEPEPEPEAEPENGNGSDGGFEVQQRSKLHAPSSRAAAPGAQARLFVAANPDGSVTIDVTDPARVLVVLGDPESNVVTVGEVPMPAE